MAVLSDPAEVDRKFSPSLGILANWRLHAYGYAIAAIYAPDAVLYEPHAAATGYEAIDEAVAALLASLPSEFAITAQGPAVGHHGIARLRWSAGPANGPAMVTGTDVGLVAEGRIRSLYVLLDPAGA